MGKFPTRFGRETVNVLKVFYYERGMVGWGRKYREIIRARATHSVCKL